MKFKTGVSVFLVGLFLAAQSGFAANDQNFVPSGDFAPAEKGASGSESLESAREPQLTFSENSLDSDKKTDSAKFVPSASGPIQEVRNVSWPAKEGDEPESITVRQSSSNVFKFDRAVTRVAVSNSDICDITTLGPQEVLMYCPKPGRINMLAWDTDYQIAIYDIQSVIDFKKAEELLEHLDPDGTYQVVPYGDSVTVYGDASAVEKVKKVETAIRAFNSKATSYVQVNNPKQILLEVRFAEIDRNASKNYGLDGEFVNRFIAWRSFVGGAHDGSAGEEDPNLFTPDGAARSMGFLSQPDPERANQYFSYIDQNYNVQTFLKWLEEKNILKLTARPNVLAMDGEEANFVVGGESPYIVSTNNTVNVTFKEFGTKLKFKPTLMDGNKIRLNMNLEVSELDYANSVSLQGTTVPSLVKTTHSTVAELKDNQILVVGGLINQRINKIESKVPILGDIRILDRIFRKTEFSRKDIELLVVVTPHVVEPFNNTSRKNMYPPEAIADASAVYTPAYPDMQADMINRLLVQDERYHDFDGYVMKRAKEVEAEFVEIKKRETMPQKAGRLVTGVRIEEQVDPNSKPAPALS